MKYRALALILLLGATACQGTREAKLPSSGQAAQQSVPTKSSEQKTAAEPFPAGFDHPLSADVLTQAVAAGDTSRIRRHGWYLFAGLNTPASHGLPLWRSWPTSTPTYAAPLSDKMAGPGEQNPRSLIQRNRDNTPVDLPTPQYPVPEAVCQKHFPGQNCPGSLPNLYQIRDGDIFQSNGDIMLAGVIYNQVAFEWIRGTQPQGGPTLFEASTLTSLLLPRKPYNKIPEFPAGSFVLKHMYWPLPGDACGALPVWDNPRPPAPAAYMGYETWTRAVAVATAGCKVPVGMTTQVSFLHGVLDASNPPHPLPPRVFKDAKVVPLSAFYSQTFTQQQLDALSSNDRALLDASALWAYGRAFRAGDAIVSIAMHIFTKEMPAWTMQSFWWHDEPDKGPYASDRPAIPPTQAPETWRHYLMVSEYGIPDAPPRSAQLPVHFNPYIELVIHPVETNCRNCHMRAAWPRKPHTMEPNMESPFAAYQLKAPETEPGLLANLRPDDPIFKKLLLLDFQWALSDRAIPVK